MIFDDLRFLKRLSLWLLLPLLVITAVLLAAAYWLCATESGARWLIGTLRDDGIATEHIEGTVKDGLHIRGLSFASDGTQVRIEDISASWQLMSILGGQLVVESISATGVRLTIATPAEPGAAAPWPAWHLPIPVELRNLAVSGLGISSADLDYRLDQMLLKARINPFKTYIDQLELKAPELGQLSLTGSLSNRYPYNQQLALDWQYLRNEQTYSGHLKTHGNLKKLRVEHNLGAPYEIATSGELSLPSSRTIPNSLNELSYSLSNQWQRPVYPFGATEPGADNGTLTINGSGTDYSLNAEARLVSAEMPAEILRTLHGSQLSLQGEGNPSTLTLKPLTVVAPWGNGTATGSIDWQSGFSWQGTLMLQDIATATLVPDLQAIISAEIETRGAITPQTKEADFRVRSLSGLLHGHVVDGAGEIRLNWQQGLTATLNNVYLDAGQNSARLSGSIARSSDLSWQIDGRNLAELGPDFGGTLHSRGTLTGFWPQLKVRGEANGQHLRYRDWRTNDLGLGFQSQLANQIGRKVNDQSQEQLQPQDADPASQGTLVLRGLRASGIEPVNLEVAATGSPDQHRLDVKLVQGMSDLRIELNGGLQKAQWQGEISSLDLNLPYTDPWQLNKVTTLTLAPQTLAIAPFCLHSATGNACGRISYLGDRLDSSLDLANIDLAFVRQWMPPASTFNGMLDGSLTLAGPLDALAGHYRLISNKAELGLKLTDEKNLAQPLSFISSGSWQKGRIQTTTDLVLPQAGEFAINATIALPSTELSGNITGTLDSLDWLQALTDQVQDIAGTIDSDIELGGSARQPNIRGRLALRHFKARAPATGTRIDDSELTLAFDNSSWTLDATAISAGQTLQIQGFGDINSGPVNLALTGDSFPLIDSNGYQARISPNLNIEYADNTATLRGSLLVPEADIHIKPRPAGITEVSTDEVITPKTREAPSVIRVKTDLTLTLGDRVQFEGYGLTTSLKGNLRIRRQNPGLPTARGTITLGKGTYEAYGQELDVSQGLLLFQGPLDNPGLNIRAQRQTREALVGVNIGGTANKIESTLFSEPALPQTHALSLLVTGKLPGNFSQTEGNQMANTAAALGISQSEWLTTQLQQGLGVDVLALQGGDTYLDSSVIVGKYLSPKLYVSYVQKLFSPQGSLAFEYHIDQRLGLKAESGDAQSLDIQYRIEH